MRDYPAIDTWNFVLNGSEFKAETFQDDDMREPWKEHDGHGIISDWTTRDKSPGERVLVSDRTSKRYYDIAETQKIALAGGWNAQRKCDNCRDTDYPVAETSNAHMIVCARCAVVIASKPLTKNRLPLLAAESDFNHMRAWCNGEWTWIWIKVTLLDADGEETSEYETLGGIEGDSGMDYFKSSALELAEEIAGRMSSAEYAGDIPCEVGA